MDKFYGTLLITLLTISVSNAQSNQKFDVRFSTGVASGWWIYTLGSGHGIDRTDNEPKISFELESVYHYKRLGVGLGIGYSYLTDNSMEAFEDTRAQRRKYLIAENSVKFWQFYLLGEYHLYSNERFTLSPQLKLGTFTIETIHPQKDNFGGKFYYELSAMNQFTLANNLGLTLKPFYQVMMIQVKQETMPGEKHRIFSLGLACGLRYRF